MRLGGFSYGFFLFFREDCINPDPGCGPGDLTLIVMPGYDRASPVQVVQFGKKKKNANQ